MCSCVTCGNGDFLAELEGQRQDETEQENRTRQNQRDM